MPVHRTKLYCQINHRGWKQQCSSPKTSLFGSTNNYCAQDGHTGGHGLSTFSFSQAPTSDPKKRHQTEFALALEFISAQPLNGYFWKLPQRAPVLILETLHVLNLNP